jgi:hypothetical protein
MRATSGEEKGGVRRWGAKWRRGKWGGVVDPSVAVLGGRAVTWEGYGRERTQGRRSQ